jgi:colicin import membrane protein
MRDDVQEQIRQAAEDLEFAPVEVQEIDPVLADIAKRYPVTDAAIAELKAKFAPLDIAGVEDKKGYALVHDARMTVRGLRTDVERKRKALKEDSLEYGRKVDAEAGRIKKLLEPLEESLEAEEERIDAEKEAIRAAAQKEKDAELQRRVDALNAVHHPYNIGDLAAMPATAFALVLATATEAHELREKERLAAEAALAEKRAEEERLAREQAEAKAAAEKAERERLAAERAKLDAEQAEFRRQQEEFQAQRRAQEQADRDKRIAEEAAARAKAEAERQAAEEAARKEREAKEAAEAATQAEARRQAAAAARPDADKLLGLAETLRGTAFPKLATAEGQKVITETALLVAKVVKYVEDKAAALSPKVMA